MASANMETRTGPATPPGPAGTLLAEATGYAHDGHQYSWAAIPSGTRRSLITAFTCIVAVPYR